MGNIATYLPQPFPETNVSTTVVGAQKREAQKQTNKPPIIPEHRKRGNMISKYCDTWGCLNIAQMFEDSATEDIIETYGEFCEACAINMIYEEQRNTNYEPWARPHLATRQGRAKTRKPLGRFTSNIHAQHRKRKGKQQKTKK